MFSFLRQHDCKEELKQFSLKATPARIAVMRLLENTKEPVDVSSIMDYLRQQDVDSDPATIFRIMNLFTNRGVTRQISFEAGKARYELANRRDHHHLICESCGHIEDVSDTVVPDLEKEISSKHRFLVKRHSLEFFGLCKKCQQ